MMSVIELLSHDVSEGSSSDYTASSTPLAVANPVANTEKEVVGPTMIAQRKRKSVACQSEKPFFCERCLSTFLSKSNLEMHKIAVHQQLRPFQCKECEYVCTTKGTLTRHVKMVHQHKRPFACSECGKCFATRSCVQRHIKTGHKHLLQSMLPTTEKLPASTSLSSPAVSSTTVTTDIKNGTGTDFAADHHILRI